ncbi:MAG TPA: hypothetical protein DCX53_12175 [Anaerolineae bacterium]|nr:hypothetical protein [Anaerolineae bacterium]
MSEHELWNELGNLYFVSGAYDKAVRAYNRAIDINPEIGEPYSNLALTYTQMGKNAEAVSIYQRGIHLLKDDLDKAVSLHKLGEIYYQLKQFTRAAETYQQIETLVSDFGQIVEASEPVDLLLHCQPSESHPNQQRFNPFDEIPSNTFLEAPPMLDDLSTAWWFDGQSESIESDGFNYDFGFVDGEGTHYVDNNIVYTEPLKWEVETFIDPESTDDFEDVLSSDNVESLVLEIDSVPDSIDMPNTVNSIKDKSEAGAGIQSEAQKPPLVDLNTHLPESNPPAVMVVTDESEFITETPEFAVQITTDVEAVQYDTPMNWQAISLSDDERLEIDADIDRFKKALDTNPRNAYAWDVLGDHYKTLGQYDDAINAYENAVRIDTTQAFYLHHLALVYAAVGRHDDAIHTFERVIGVDPNHGLAHATLGGYYRKYGNEELAKVHIEKARQLLDNDENEYNRACMESICGNADRSLELLEIALKNKQTYVNWARKDPDLDFIRSDPRFQTLLQGVQ